MEEYDTLASTSKSSYTIIQFSPKKTRISPRRALLPSPEQQRQIKTTILVSPRKRLFSTSNVLAESSPKNPRQELIKNEFDIDIKNRPLGLQAAVKASKNVDLSFSLVENGRATSPRGEEQWVELFSLFPTTWAVEVHPPYLLFRVKTIPPKPWPFTVGGLCIRFTTKELVESEDFVNKGRGGKGPKVLEDFDLQHKDNFSADILQKAIANFVDSKIKIHDIAWFAGYWQITIPKDMDMKKVPSFIAHHRAFYKLASEVTWPNPSALSAKIPSGIQYDDTQYFTSPSSILRPGIMLSSSVRCVDQDGVTVELYKTTTSGILVVDSHGEIFVTVATHGFEADGLVYHPDPKRGVVIGRIVRSLANTDISLMKLSPGVNYTNETFGSPDSPQGIPLGSLLSAEYPDIRIYDTVEMDNPFSGRCEGQVRAFGAVFPDLGSGNYVEHTWYEFDNPNGIADGSCGSTILHDNGVLGFFIFQKNGDLRVCLAISAQELKKRGYEVFPFTEAFSA